MGKNKIYTYYNSAGYCVTDNILNNSLAQFIWRCPNGQAIKWIQHHLKNFIIRNFINIFPNGFDVAEAILERPQIVSMEEEPLANTHLIKTGMVLRFPQTFSDSIFEVLDFFREYPAKKLRRLSVPDAIKKSKELHLKIRRVTEDQFNDITTTHYRALNGHFQPGIRDFKAEISIKLKAPKEGLYPILIEKDKSGWYEITSLEQLEFEGLAMGHCVKSYWREIEIKKSVIFTYRDKDLMPELTAQFCNFILKIIQVRGKYNSRDIDKAKVCNLVDSYIGPKYKSIIVGDGSSKYPFIALDAW